MENFLKLFILARQHEQTWSDIRCVFLFSLFFPDDLQLQDDPDTEIERKESH